MTLSKYWGGNPPHLIIGGTIPCPHEFPPTSVAVAHVASPWTFSKLIDGDVSRRNKSAYLRRCFLLVDVRSSPQDVAQYILHQSLSAFSPSSLHHRHIPDDDDDERMNFNVA